MRRLLILAACLLFATPLLAQYPSGVYPFSPSSFTGGTLTSPVTFSNAAGSIATMGTDLVTNGTFTGNANGWTLGGGGGAPDWAYNANNVTHGAGGGTAPLTPTTPLAVVAGTYYQVCLSVTLTAGTLSVSIGGTAADVSASASWCRKIVAANTNNLLLTPSNTAVATIDNFSAKPVTQATAWLEHDDATYDFQIYPSADGWGNIYIGQSAGKRAASTISGANVGIGVASLTLSEGGSNSCYGTWSCYNNDTGTDNTGVGYHALYENAVGSQNTVSGSNSGDTAAQATLSNVNVFGYNIDPTVSNVGIFGNASMTDMWFGSAAGATAAARLHGVSLLVGTANAAGEGIQGGAVKSLTDAAAAVSFVRVAMPTGGMLGGKVVWVGTSTDGTDQRTLSGETYFAFVDKAGTTTCGTPGAVGTPVLTSSNGNTLACTITAATSTTNCDLQVTCTDNTAGSQTISFKWRLDMPTTATITAQ